MATNENCVPFGPGPLGVCHKADEWADCEQVFQTTDVLERLTERLLF